jgi:hypothetical protein
MMSAESQIAMFHDLRAWDVSLDDQIRAVRREIGFRERVYPGWVVRGRMTQVAADRHLLEMRAVELTLSELLDGRLKI